ncbi:hypothetical protein PYW07_009781 [Mythimna separata]|uniref:Uncharacterized protein n=1 Tax=Mythimna separata TaxID=271217 RepID=A0AAD7YCW6_MYTSE|nr:hypothetical protein PYW07_009781 [Mythimna separata]
MEAQGMCCLLELTPAGDIFCDAKGCHVADALCKGQYVGVKARDKLIWRLKMMIVFCDAKGCHVADALCKGQYVGVKARDKLIWRLKVCAVF